MSTPVSVLDLATVVDGGTSAEALRRTIELGEWADTAGLHRLWVAEHHNMPWVASTSPPVIAAALGARTSRLRVGSGGVMLPNHRPYVVAEQFAALEAMFPGRIDLGLGRAPGTDPRTAAALRGAEARESVDDFPRHVAALMEWFSPSPSPTSAAATLRATPVATTQPEIWLLGSSEFAAVLAGRLGLSYCYAAHFGHLDPATVLGLYREHFAPSDRLERPHAMVCTSAVIGDDAEHADFLAKPGRLAALGMMRGQRQPILSPEQAASVELTELDRAVLPRTPAPKFVGDPHTVTTGLAELVERSGADELMIASTVHGAEERRRTLSEIVTALG